MKTLLNNTQMQQEERNVINNLFEFWNFVGNSSKTILETPDYKAIIPNGSDWPRRIFDLREGAEPECKAFEQLAAQIVRIKLPDLLTLTGSVSLRHKECLSNSGFTPWLRQLGMVIHLNELILKDAPAICSFKMVRDVADADLYASIASRSFNYLVGSHMIKSLLGDEKPIKLFVGSYSGIPACCGLVFYDRYGFAGLHLIGTLPEFRGKGLASMVTTRLLKECIEDGKPCCVLHASAAGEKVYAKLGFSPVKEILTYKLDRP